MIRIRHPQGTATLRLAELPSLGALQARIAELTGIAAAEQELRTGYPPRPVPLSSLPPATAVSDAPLSLSAGSQLVVSQASAGSSSSSRPVTPRAAAVPSTPAPAAAAAPAARAMAPPLVPKPKAAPPFARTAAPAPATPTPAAPRRAPQDAEVHREVDGSELTLRIVPDDNSCLFNAVAGLQLGGLGEEKCAQLREIVCSAIVASPHEYSEVMLGMAPETYCKRMRQPATWGGAIELAILAQHFATELIAVDVGSGVVHTFGEGQGFEERAWLVYSGIHYDFLALLPHPTAPLEFGTTRFPSLPAGLGLEDGDELRTAVLDIVAELRARHYYTDTATFALRCGQCRTPLKGEKDATKHAKETGHTQFVEYDA
ncbi:OTU-domain-containing protein [Tilletiopsis washingtonensis]|uniref:Ubiquitin thioesterase OTU n=1 Tax=Tilletiopsis washingtonensis TaxID=58919 RepID=A0A316Z998_9BASI|nr:OTU-domain-containing protein [Tilletiopsis washingtonensis]PWN98320.1 OTU-domain-containing protein [Tilletiopsis washingtonensis]